VESLCKEQKIELCSCTNRRYTSAKKRVRYMFMILVHIYYVFVYPILPDILDVVLVPDIFSESADKCIVIWNLFCLPHHFTHLVSFACNNKMMKFRMLVFASHWCCIYSINHSNAINFARSTSFNFVFMM